MRLRYVVAGCVVAASLAVLGLAWGSGSSTVASVPSRPLVTAIFDSLNFPGPEAPVAFSHARQTGASVARLTLEWNQIAPNEPSPASDPTSPANPAYKWASVDRQVELALQHGLEPILDVFNPPAWALKAGGSVSLPELRDPAEVGKFMRAAARRYSGSFQGLPRVRYWQAWNEPNLSYYLSPQYRQGEVASPAVYRQIVNSVADAVHAVHGDNVVIAGATSPYQEGDATSDPQSRPVALAPMRFMQALLCMSSDPTPKPVCNDTVTFDVWAHHPYTRGGPHGAAAVGGNVELGNLPEMKALLDAAVKAHHVQSNGPVRFWVTEFSWDSNPTDPKGVPAALEAAWVSEAMWEMWNWGVSLVTWFLVHDQIWSPNPDDDKHFQSSLYQPGATLAQDKPKPALAAFRFPFVGHVEKGKVVTWGRTPWGKPGRVLVEESGKNRKTGWKRLGIVTTDKYGIFAKTFGAPTGSFVRARVLGKGGLAAPAFPLAGPKSADVSPFGS